MPDGDRLIFAHGDWQICRPGTQGEPPRPVWEYRDGAYCCDRGAELAAADLPAAPLDAAADADALAFQAAGFAIYQTGGGCTAWRKEAGPGLYVLVTGDDGCSHTLSDPSESYLIGLHDETECIASDTVRGAAEAIQSAEEMAR